MCGFSTAFDSALSVPGCQIRRFSPIILDFMRRRTWICFVRKAWISLSPITPPQAHDTHLRSDDARHRRDHRHPYLRAHRRGALTAARPCPYRSCWPPIWFLPVCALPSSPPWPRCPAPTLLTMPIWFVRAHRLLRVIFGDLILEYAQATIQSAGWSGSTNCWKTEKPASAGQATAATARTNGRHHLLQPARFRHRAHHHVRCSPSASTRPSAPMT